LIRSVDIIACDCFCHLALVAICHFMVWDLDFALAINAIISAMVL